MHLGIDDFIRSHSEFISRIVERCLLSPTNKMSRRTLSLLTNIFSITAKWIALQRSLLGSELDLDTAGIKTKQHQFDTLGTQTIVTDAIL